MPTETQVVAAAEARLAELREHRERTRQRFEAAIEERRTSQEAIKNLELKLRVDREALDRLLGQASVPAAIASPQPMDGAAPAPVLLANLPNVAGVTGPAGVAGTPGALGAPGALSAPGALGVPSVTGMPGVTGMPSVTGTPSVAGTPGGVRAVPAPPPPTIVEMLQAAAGGKLPGIASPPSGANGGGAAVAALPTAPGAGVMGPQVSGGAAAAFLPPGANPSVVAPPSGASIVPNNAGTASSPSSGTGSSSTPAAVPLTAPFANPIPSPLPNPLANPLTASSPGAPAMSPAAPLSGPAKANSKALQEASAVAQRTVEAANQAEQEARTLTERIDLLRRSIDAERRLRDASQARADEMEGEVRAASDEMHRALMEGLDASDIIDRVQVAEDRRREVRQELTRVNRHLDELQTEYAELQSEHIAALEVAEDKRDAADAALKRVETLLNPFAPANIFQWLVDHGPRVLGVLLAIAVTIWLSRVLGRRLVRMAASRAGTDVAEERQNRAQTLAGVVHNAINIGAVTVGIVTILDELGVPVGPVMGGAAVLGLAVAFGAQSLIKDYFTGFMLLVEQQYLVNDVVRIGDITGQVERISLRMTVLRDLEGQAHFIPHGQITTVSNLTHSWSRAVLTIAVSYRENVDRVIDELIALTRELRDDPQFGRLITEDVNMLGVDELGESAVNIKFFLKTRPLQQWPVKRELLRRIKNRFDEMGIEIPFPQRTIHMRYSDGSKPVLREVD